MTLNALGRFLTRTLAIVLAIVFAWAFVTVTWFTFLVVALLAIAVVISIVEMFSEIRERENYTDHWRRLRNKPPPKL